MKYKDYNDLKKELKNLPITWYPTLIIEMAKTAYKRKAFVVPGGASRLIKELEEKHGWRYGFKIKEKE